MAISKIRTGSIEDGSVTQADIDPAFVTSINTNPQLSGTSSMLVPKGSTAQRPASPVLGQLRFNTSTDCLEQYTSVGWAGIAAPPAISSVSPTTFNGETGTTITINGQGFDVGAAIKFITSGGAEYNAGTVSFVNVSQLTATTPRDFTVADEPLSVKIISGNGLSFTLAQAIDCGGAPTWVTSAGSLGSVIQPNSASFTVSATDPDSSATVSYSVTTGSLPTGLSLNSSTGAITGNPSGYTNVSNTVSFTITATDNAGNTSSRSFSINVIVTNYFGSGADGTGSF